MVSMHAVGLKEAEVKITPSASEGRTWIEISESNNYHIHLCLNNSEVKKLREVLNDVQL